MSPQVTTFLLEAANFLVLAAALSWLFFRPIRKAIADRRSKLAEQELSAEQKLADAQQAEEQAQASHKQFQAELEQLRAKELAAAKEHAEHIVAEARAAANAQLETARRRAAQLSDTQRDQLSAAAAAAAGELVRRLLVDIDGPDLQSALLQAACGQLAELPAGPMLPVKVESAQPLSPPDRKMLEAALGESGDAAEFLTAPELMEGVRITTRQGLVDASVHGLAQYARHALTSQMKRAANGESFHSHRSGH